MLAILYEPEIRPLADLTSPVKLSSSRNTISRSSTLPSIGLGVVPLHVPKSHLALRSGRGCGSPKNHHHRDDHRRDDNKVLITHPSSKTQTPRQGFPERGVATSTTFPQTRGPGPQPHDNQLAAQH